WRRTPPPPPPPPSRHRVAGHRPAHRGARRGVVPALALSPRAIFEGARAILRLQHAGGELLAERQRQRGIRATQVLEPVRWDEHQGHRVGGDGIGRAGSVAKEGEIAQELALAQDAEHAVLAAEPLPDLDLALVHHEGLALGVVPLAEDELAGLVGLGRDVSDLAAHARPLAAREWYRIGLVL